MELPARVRDLCLFRGGPQDLPYAPRVLIALLVASAILEAAFDLRSGSSVAVIVGANFGTLVALGALALMLRWRGKPARFVQAALGLAATGFLFELIALPLALIVGHPTDPASLKGTQIVAALVLFALLVWQACIAANILRQALEIPLAAGVLALLALGFVDLFASGLIAVLLGAA